tara:strand:- start:93296 stop:93868 length:573 start_codon:yes stop_codon:yes gene_type:complete
MAHDITTSKFVSLGSNCSVAYQLVKYGKRLEAYPFDYCIIPLNKLIEVLLESFKEYSDVEVHKLSKNHKIFDSDESSYIVKNKYNVKFAHELTKKEDVKNFSKRLDIRIKRFLDLVNPTFIRIELQNLKKETFIKRYRRLIEILESIFINFKIIIISNYEFNHKKVKWVKLNKYVTDWKYDYLDWNKILE